jgi:dUTP pyrophosphatase
MEHIRGRARRRKEIQIDVHYLSDIDHIEKIEDGDWLDLRAAETVELEAGNSYKIPLGVEMKLPENYEALILPRSSTFEKYGVIMVCSGLIDNTYRSEWSIVFYATRDAIINKNERICQFRIQQNMSKIDFNVVDSLEQTGRGGFGSTGVADFITNEDSNNVTDIEDDSTPSDDEGKKLKEEDAKKEE